MTYSGNGEAWLHVRPNLIIGNIVSMAACLPSHASTLEWVQQGDVVDVKGFG